MSESADSVLLVYCTCPDEATAQKIADHLVGERLAACVNIIPALRSTYRWKGEIQRDPESLMLIKTVATRLPDLSKAVRALHPYELPEIIAVPVTGGLPEYLAWVRDNTRDQ